jgi:hypothetical protein
MWPITASAASLDGDFHFLLMMFGVKEDRRR